MDVDEEEPTKKGKSKFEPETYNFELNFSDDDNSNQESYVESHSAVDDEDIPQSEEEISDKSNPNLFSPIKSFPRESQYRKKSSKKPSLRNSTKKPKVKE